MPKKRFSENTPKITKTWVIADFAYIVPWNEYCDRPWPLIFPGRRGPHRSLWISPKTQNPYIESSPTKNLGLASSQFLDILYPWIGSIKGHYRLVRPGRRGSCGTLVIYKRNQQANVQFGLKQNLGLASSQFWHISEVLVISTVWCPHWVPAGRRGRGYHPPNLTSRESGKCRKSDFQKCLLK